MGKRNTRVMKINKPHQCPHPHPSSLEPFNDYRVKEVDFYSY